MAKKQLSVTGPHIKEFDVFIKNTSSSVGFVVLEIETEDGLWEYEICVDVHSPDLTVVESDIRSALLKAQGDYSKIKIFERDPYLFVEIQDHLNKKYWGRKTK